MAAMTGTAIPHCSVHDCHPQECVDRHPSYATLEMLRSRVRKVELTIVEQTEWYARHEPCNKIGANGVWKGPYRRQHSLAEVDLQWHMVLHSGDETPPGNT